MRPIHLFTLMSLVITPCLAEESKDQISSSLVRIQGVGDSAVYSFQFTQGGPAQLTKRLDATSPQFLMACATGQRLPLMTVFYPSGSGNYITYRLEDVLVTADSHIAGPSSLERVTLKPSKVKIETIAGSLSARAPAASRVTYNINSPQEANGNLTSLQIGLGVQPPSQPSTRSGAVHFQDASITKDMDAYSAQLEMWHMQGRVLPKVSISVGPAGLRYDLSDATISGYTRTGTVEKITFKYNRLEINAAQPSKGTPAKVGWDLNAAKKM